jgi:hypothetical protein
MDGTGRHYVKLTEADTDKCYIFSFICTAKNVDFKEED